MGPAYMARVEGLTRLEVLHSLMIGEDGVRGCAGFEECVSMSKQIDNSKKFAVVCAITAFNIGPLAKPVSDGF